MTCVAAIVQNGVSVIAGERGASDSNIILPLSTSKVWQSGQYLFGYSGSLEGEVVKESFIPPVAPKAGLNKFMHGEFLLKLKEFYDEYAINKDSSELGLLIIINDVIYEHNVQDMSMSAYDSTFLSAGSGSEYAMGSLYSTTSYKDPKKRLRMALEASIQYSPTCTGTIDILEKA